MSVNCAGRHVCEPAFYPSSMDERWACPECKREHVPFDASEQGDIPESVRKFLQPGSLGWRTAARQR